MWTINEGAAFIQALNDKIQEFDYHPGIIGSVLTKGKSDNDLDIALLPYEGLKENGELYEPDRMGLSDWLKSMGAIPIKDDSYSQTSREVYDFQVMTGEKINFMLYF